VTSRAPGFSVSVPVPVPLPAMGLLPSWITWLSLFLVEPERVPTPVTEAVAFAVTVLGATDTRGSLARIMSVELNQPGSGQHARVHRRVAQRRGARLQRWALLMVAVILTAVRPAAADSQLTWSGDWRRVGATEYATIGGLWLGTATVMLWIPPAEEPAWRSPRLMDWGVRERLRIDTRPGREAAAMLSDVLAVASLVQPLVVDSLIVAGLVDGSMDVLHQTEVINLQAFAMTQFVNVTAKRFFARERPYVTACASDPTATGSCDDVDRFRSYYSGHAAISATGAGLVCAHHTHLELYGGRPFDGIACGAAVGIALATGALRIAADRHWATDVITGHVLGFASGFLVPSLVYYKSLRREPESTTDTGQAMLRRSDPPTLAFSGTF
ncbi:MAG TPA: phosphatase PAP2 family protein, partial [Polyangiaceae bacterium]|nr:phosphatase PAP2 family protein [Polyangiaceae bacterium]